MKITNDPHKAVLGANVLYTDVWSSMGEENLKENKDKDFNGFTIDRNLVNKANKDAIILHCLPAYRSKEITDEVMIVVKVEFLIKQKIECMLNKLFGVFAFLKILALATEKRYKCISEHLYCG